LRLPGCESGEAGDDAETTMDEDVRDFGTLLGGRLLARDWAGAHALLAPWLRATLSPDDVRRFFEDEYRKTLAESGIDAMHYPEHPEPELGGNQFTNATSLREPMSWKPGYVRPVAAEVTDANMRYWMSMQLPCSDQQMADLDFDFFAEVWIAVVQTEEGLRAGYWSHGAY
jgi:hypothetical protein